MELGKFLSLCAVLFAFMAGVFLSKVLLVSSEQILRGTYHYSPMGWPSVAIISDKAAQKADTLVSIVLAIIALFLQIIALFAKSDMGFTSTRLKAAAIAVALVCVVGISIRQVGLAAKKMYGTEIKRLAASDYVKSTVDRQSCPLYSGVEAIANQYFAFKRNDEEEGPDFVKRFATHLGFELSKDVDFSKFQ